MNNKRNEVLELLRTFLSTLNNENIIGKLLPRSSFSQIFCFRLHLLFVSLSYLSCKGYTDGSRMGFCVEGAPWIPLPLSLFSANHFLLVVNVCTFISHMTANVSEPSKHYSTCLSPFFLLLVFLLFPTSESPKLLSLSCYAQKSLPIEDFCLRSPVAPSWTRFSHSFSSLSPSSALPYTPIL